MFQKVIIIGNLGRDPEMRFTSSGNPVTSLSVATNNKFTNAAGQQVNKISWFRASAWGKTAENCNKYLKKGSKVYIEGRLESDDQGNPKTFTRKDGTTGAAYDLTVEIVKFLSSAENTAAPEDTGSFEHVSDLAAEDIPF